MALTRDFLEGLGVEKDVVEKIMKEHGKAVQEEKNYDTLKQDYEQLKDKFGKLEKADEENATFKAQLAEKEQLIKDHSLKILKYQVATEKGIPLELATRLSGDTEEALRKDAETLASFVSAGGKQILPLKQESTPSDDPYKELASKFTKES